MIERDLVNLRSAYLLFGKSRTDSNYIYNIALNHADVSKVATPQCFELFPFTLALLLLLGKTLVTERIRDE